MLAAYERAQRAIAAAYDPADPHHPGLLEALAGPVLQRHQTILTDYQAQGVPDVALEKVSNSRVVAVDATSATIENCLMVRSGWALSVCS